MRRPASRATTESLDDESSTVVLDINVADVSTPRDSLAAQEEAELVRQALMRLPENYRTVLVLRHYENLKLREIAEVLEVPEGTVSSRMAEALSQLTRAAGAEARAATETPTRKGTVSRMNHPKREEWIPLLFGEANADAKQRLEDASARLP